MIEVLVAVLILAIGLLGVAALQAAALRNSQSSYERSEAVIQSYSMLDMMRANVDAARAGSYNVGWTCTVPAAGTSRIAADRRAWLQNVQAVMGETACGRIACTTTVCTVGVRWDDSRGTEGSATLAIETSSQL